MLRRIAWTKSELAIIGLPVLGLLLFAGWIRFKPTTRTVDLQPNADNALLVTSPKGKIAALRVESTSRFPTKQNVLGGPPDVTSRIRLLDITTAEVLKELPLPTMVDQGAFDSGLAFSPDGAYLATTYCCVLAPVLTKSGRNAGPKIVLSRNLVIWDVKTGLKIVDLHLENVSQFSGFAQPEWSPDGKLLLVDGGHPYLMDWNSKRSLREVPIHSYYGGFSCSVKFSPDGRSLITQEEVISDYKKRVCQNPARWDLQGRFLEHLPPSRYQDVGTQRIVEFDSYLEITDISTGKRLWSVKPEWLAFDWCVQGDRLYVWEWYHDLENTQAALMPGSSTVSVWDLTGRKLLWQASTDRHIEKCFPSPDGRFLASIGQTPTGDSATMGDHWNNPRQVVIWRADGSVAQKTNFIGPALTFTWANDSKSALWSSGETATYWKAPEA